MLAVYLLLIAFVVGALFSRGDRRAVLIYVPAALVGALLGAFVAFGDTPFLLSYPVFNPFTLALLGSVGLVACVRVWRNRRATKS